MVNKEYLIQYFVGLLEADGSIQVNHWRYKSLQFRLIIKLKNLPSNREMLFLISKAIGGHVRSTNKNEFVIWVVNDRKKIIKLLTIFDKYPLLTARKICQLKFLKICLKNLDITEYFATRDSKYSELGAIIRNKPFQKIIKSGYFNIWLAGFIEGEGCFCIRKNKSHSFSISQKYEKYLLNTISEYFNSSNKVREIKKDFYLIEVYKKETLLNIRKFCLQTPLIGAKKDSFLKFSKQMEWE